jgi:hypothetical protein
VALFLAVHDAHGLKLARAEHSAPESDFFTLDRPRKLNPFQVIVFVLPTAMAYLVRRI